MPSFTNKLLHSRVCGTQGTEDWYSYGRATNTTRPRDGGQQKCGASVFQTWACGR